MNGILKKEFYLLDVDYIDLSNFCPEDFNKDELITFRCGEKVEIIKRIESKSYLSGVGYVILNGNNDSMTVDSSLIELI